MSSVIVVTGATGALGAQVVRHLAKNGHRVAALGREHSKAQLDALAREVGSNCLPIATDIGSQTEWCATLARVESSLGPPTGAALVAGGFRGGAPMHTEPNDELWDSMVKQNLETARASLRALLPGMVARGSGSLVLVGSRAAVRPWASAGSAAYASTKAAVVALAQATAAEVLAQRVRVNVVLPSTIDTAANRAAMPDADASRWVSTESIAGVIAFLLSDAARDISGAAIPVYGQA